MDESLFKMTRDPRGLLRIDFAHGVAPSLISDFLRRELRATPLKSFEDVLGDVHDVEFRIGLSQVSLAADNWTTALMSESRWSNVRIRSIARRLRRWEPRGA